MYLNLIKLRRKYKWWTAPCLICLDCFSIILATIQPYFVLMHCSLTNSKILCSTRVFLSFWGKYVSIVKSNRQKITLSSVQWICDKWIAFILFFVHFLNVNTFRLKKVKHWDAVKYLLFWHFSTWVVVYCDCETICLKINFLLSD